MIMAAAVNIRIILAVSSGPPCELKQFGDTDIIFVLAYWVLGTAGYSSEVHFLLGELSRRRWHRQSSQLCLTPA